MGSIEVYLFFKKNKNKNLMLNKQQSAEKTLREYFIYQSFKASRISNHLLHIIDIIMDFSFVLLSLATNKYKKNEI